MNINKVTFLVKQTRWQRVVVDVEHGYEMPETATHLVALIEDIKAQPYTFCNDDSWGDDVIDLSDLDIVKGFTAQSQGNLK